MKALFLLNYFPFNLFLFSQKSGEGGGGGGPAPPSARPWGINPTNSVVIPQSLVLRSFVLG